MSTRSGKIYGHVNLTNRYNTFESFANNCKEIRAKELRILHSNLIGPPKKGLLKSIREDFPLQSLISGEESMTLGDLSADKGTLKEILGTDNFEEIQQSLSVRDNPPPPSIVYNAGETGEQIPIAEIKTVQKYQVIIKIVN